MSSLDQSLDQIIASNRKARSTAGRVTKRTSSLTHQFSGRGAGKASTKSTNKDSSAQLKHQTIAKLASKTVDLSYATKVVCYNLPRDLKQENIKDQDFFQAQVGEVQTVTMNFNEKGHFKGTATINFKSGRSAAIAVEKYNGAPIDNGVSRLKMEILIDTSKQPLATRIAPIVPKKDYKAKQVKSEAKPGNKLTRKSNRSLKKTVQQLDQEMTEYFNN